MLKSGSEFWRVNRRLAYLTLVNAIGHGLAGEYLAPYLTQVKHISDIELGLRFTITILGQGAVRYLVGHLLDKRLEFAIPLIRLGTVLVGILWLLLVYAPGPFALILYIISGILTPLFTGSATIYLLKTSKPEARSTVLGTF